MKKLIVFLVFLVFTSSFMYSQVFMEDSLRIQEIATLDTSSTHFVLGRQTIVMDKNNVIHLFYAIYGQTVDTVWEVTSSDYGMTWSVPDPVVEFSHSPNYVREHIKEISAAVDSNNDIHLVYRYDGPPYYLSGWNDYPPSHINYVKKVNGTWTTYQDVINDEAVQVREGNGNTVCYLGFSQLVSYNGILHYISNDYAWWATKYHIIYSNTLGGNWAQGDTLRTFDLGEIDNIMLEAPSLIVNNQNLFAVWYQKYNCTIEMKSYSANSWSNVSTIFTDKYFPATRPSYSVRTGSVQINDGRSATAMIRNVHEGYNELILIRKEANSDWQIDTIQVNDKYGGIEPSIYQDTTYLYLFGGTDHAASLVKFSENAGFLGQKKIILDNPDERILSIKCLSDGSLPFVYLIRKNENKYAIKIGKLEGVVTDVETRSNNLPAKFELFQNYPNPFNPTTTISYVIASGRDAINRVSTKGALQVSLKVYDALGREVATLVNKKQAPGKYSARFNATGLPSGIYFYTLHAGNFVQTKKLVLMK